MTAPKMTAAPRVAVVDASSALSLVLPSESLSPAACAAIQQASLEAPALFAYETANAIATAIRRDRLTAAQGSYALALIAQLGIHLAAPPNAAACADLAVSCALTGYDAAYLLLARDRGALLITQDVELRQAADKHGVAVLS